MTIRRVTSDGGYKMHEDQKDFGGTGWWWSEDMIKGSVPFKPLNIINIFKGAC
jgi:hypothetical protein